MFQTVSAFLSKVGDIENHHGSMTALGTAVGGAAGVVGGVMGRALACLIAQQKPVFVDITTIDGRKATGIVRKDGVIEIMDEEVGDDD